MTCRTRARQSPEQRRLVRLAASYNTKARRYGLRGVIYPEQLYLIEWRDRACHYCGIGLEIGKGTFDHIQSLNKGGLNTSANIVRCCTTCNRRKFTKTPSELLIHDDRIVQCARPGCTNTFKPRWAEYEAGRARLCSRRCASLWRWEGFDGLD